MKDNERFALIWFLNLAAVVREMELKQQEEGKNDLLEVLMEMTPELFYMLGVVGTFGTALQYSKVVQPNYQKTEFSKEDEFNRFGKIKCVVEKQRAAKAGIGLVVGKG